MTDNRKDSIGDKVAGWIGRTAAHIVLGMAWAFLFITVTGINTTPAQAPSPCIIGEMP